MKQGKKHHYLTLIALALLTSVLIVLLLRNRAILMSSEGNVADHQGLITPFNTTSSLVQKTSSHQTLSFPSLIPEKSFLFYEKLPIQDVSSLIKDCFQKNNGVSAGKICDIGNIRHYLKAVETDKIATERLSNSLLGIYNTALLKNNMHITAPNVSLVFEKDGRYISRDGVEAKASLYLASAHVQNFTLMNKLEKVAHRKFRLQHLKHSTSTLTYENIKRQELVAHIGESGIAKLAVAGTFFQDLVANTANWGYNDTGLVIIDVDHSPGTLEIYLSEASRLPGNIELDFSLHTVKLMLNSYQEMQRNEAPVIHSKVDMPQAFYARLLQLYIQACTKAIVQIEQELPALKEQQPSQKVNDILRESFLSMMTIARSKGDYTQYPLYELEEDNHATLALNTP
ncbi:MAG: hypothetical protein ACRCXC_07875 [Legionella sp.]